MTYIHIYIYVYIYIICICIMIIYIYYRVPTNFRVQGSPFQPAAPFGAQAPRVPPLEEAAGQTARTDYRVYGSKM